MPTSFARFGTTLSTFLLFIIFIAGMSKLLKTKETPKLIKGGSDFLSNLFKGVFK